MSGALSNVIEQALAVLITPQRQIGTIYPDCAVSEHHIDRLAITQNPVEIGAAITDHAFKLPPSVRLRWGWSNSSWQNALASGIGPLGILGFGSERYIDDIYRQMRQLQASAVPFSVVTGRQSYDNMLIESISAETDSESAYILVLEVECRHVLLVSTASVQSNSALSDPSKQTNPQQTQSTANRGVVAPKPNSMLYNIVTGLLGQ